MNIIYEDNHLLVVSKPPGLLVQEDHTGDPDLLNLCKNDIKERYQKPGRVYLGLVHRLDRPVSGVMVLARTSKAARRLTERFKHHQLQKKYLAIIEGIAPEQGIFEHYLVKENQRIRVTSPDYPGARYAKLAFSRIAARADLSLVDIELVTGRPHQIRVQFSHGLLPVLGDLRYGAKREFDGRNLALHSYALELIHPVRHTSCRWIAAPPETWTGFFDDDIKRHLTPAPPI
jgi:RluA family pseudouridine synthase